MFQFYVFHTPIPQNCVSRNSECRAGDSGLAYWTFRSDYRSLGQCGYGSAPLMLAAFALMLLLAGCATAPSNPSLADVPETALATEPNELDAYIAKADPSYRYELVEQQQNDAGSISLLRMISQTWLTEAEVDRPVWEHYLYVYTPKNVAHATGLIYVTGGNNDGKKPKVTKDFVDLAAATQSVVAELRMVPNQPLVFKNDDFGPRTEDEILAYGWRKYMETKDPKWIFRFAMTKAVVRAMDTVTDFSATVKGGRTKVEQYVITGASKRGWTTWMSAVADQRVVAIIPIVIDLLNVERSFVAHYQRYGFWAPAVGDYYREGLMDRMSDPAYRALMRIEDPFAYRNRLKLPKFIVNAVGDQFFRPESSRYYFHELLGENRMRYVPNAGHNVSKGTDAMASIAAYYQAILEDVPRPEMSWTIDPKGTMTVTAKQTPVAARLWTGINPKFNDFRIDSAGPIFQSVELTPTAPNTWEVKTPKPTQGFAAYFVELEWKGPGPYPFKFTTDVVTAPDDQLAPPPQHGKTQIGPQKQ